MLGAPRGVVFVHAATGRAHSLLVGSNGDVWSAGTNQHGQVSFKAHFCKRRVSVGAAGCAFILADFVIVVNPVWSVDP